MAQNNSYHVPACDWYNNGTAPRCSGFYHDQEQTPNHPGGGKPYPVDGECIEQCDCGTVNPCGEYVSRRRAVGRVQRAPPNPYSRVGCLYFQQPAVPAPPSSDLQPQRRRCQWPVVQGLVYQRVRGRETPTLGCSRRQSPQRWQKKLNPLFTLRSYMISNETLYHKNPVTGEPQMISLGWMVRGCS